MYKRILIAVLVLFSTLCKAQNSEIVDVLVSANKVFLNDTVVYQMKSSIIENDEESALAKQLFVKIQNNVLIESASVTSILTYKDYFVIDHNYRSIYVHSFDSVAPVSSYSNSIDSIVLLSLSGVDKVDMEEIDNELKLEYLNNKIFYEIVINKKTNQLIQFVQSRNDGKLSQIIEFSYGEKLLPDSELVKDFYQGKLQPIKNYYPDYSVIGKN